MCCTNHYAAVQLHRTMALNGCSLLVKLHADLLSRHASPLEVYVLWRSTKGVKVLRPTRFVIDATENSRGGVAAEVRGSQTGL